MFVATAVDGTLCALDPVMWKQIASTSKRRTDIKMLSEMGYPKCIKDKHLEQITNVFNKIIFPGQYIPHIFNDTNNNQILECGQHISEVHRKDVQYTVLCSESVPQHCRQYSKCFTPPETCSLNR